MFVTSPSGPGRNPSYLESLAFFSPDKFSTRKDPDQLIAEVVARFRCLERSSDQDLRRDGGVIGRRKIGRKWIRCDISCRFVRLVIRRGRLSR